MRKRGLANRFMLGWLAGVACCGVVAAGIVAWILFFGGYNTSAASQHADPIAWAIHQAMRTNVEKRARSVQTPVSFTPAQVTAGARAYDLHCVACHGGPAVPRATWTTAMVPTPPYLIDSPRRWSRAELYVLVRDGAKMTAMPAWGEIGPDAGIWDLIAFLEKLPSLSAADFARLRDEAKQAPPRDQPRAVGNPLLP